MLLFTFIGNFHISIFLFFFIFGYLQWTNHYYYSGERHGADRGPSCFNTLKVAKNRSILLNIERKIPTKRRRHKHKQRSWIDQAERSWIDNYLFFESIHILLVSIACKRVATSSRITYPESNAQLCRHKSSKLLIH